MSSLADGYGGYADLASAQAEETDYRVHVRPFAGSSIAVIAPHGGGIEQFTSDIARAVAGTDINLYLFEGILSFSEGDSTNYQKSAARFFLTVDVTSENGK